MELKKKVKFCRSFELVNFWMDNRLEISLEVKVILQNHLGTVFII